MPIADKYRLHRQVGWSDEAEVHAGPLDPTHGVAVAVKIRHGMGGPPRPDGNRDRFLRSANDQQAAVLAGCRGVAPVFEVGQEGNDAFYASKLYPRSLDSLIQGRVSLDAAGLQRLTDHVLSALEELRDKHGRTHGNLKPTNIFLDGKTVHNAPVVLSDLALREEALNQSADCYALGATLYQLLRGRAVRNFDWPMEHGPDWERLGASAHAWRRFCNVLMAPDLGMVEQPLAGVRQAFRKMKSLANAAPSLSGAGAGGSGGAPAPSKGGKTGLLAGVGASVAALIGAGALYLNQTNQKISDRMRGITGKVNAVSTLTPALGGLVKGLPNLPGTHGKGSPGAGGTAASGEGNGGEAGSPDASPSADVPPTPALAEATPPPTPPPTPTPLSTAGEKWLGYTALLQQFKETLNDPAALEQTDALNASLATFKDRVQYGAVSSEAGVGDFLRRLPPRLEATGDVPDLPATAWTKRSAAKQEEVQTVTYEWGNTGLKMQFNRVASANGPAFYLSATTVPVSLGLALAQRIESAGKLRGTQSVSGPVAWQYVNGSYALRPTWLPVNAFNPAYANPVVRPSADSPLNGISGAEAARLAAAASCTLPTLAQWEATLRSPAGQAWLNQWQAFAKVRSPDWAAFAKGIEAKHATGSVLPNTQCFGDNADLNAVGTSSDQNLFFEPVNTRVLRGFAHLIGNVGQYVVDDARSPKTYYFAGGSAESAPSTFSDLFKPPAAKTPFATAADAGFRLAAPAKGNGSDKNPAFDKLKRDVDTELARAAKLQ